MTAKTISQIVRGYQHATTKRDGSDTIIRLASWEMTPDQTVLMERRIKKELKDNGYSARSDIEIGRVRVEG